MGLILSMLGFWISEAYGFRVSEAGIVSQYGKFHFLFLFYGFISVQESDVLSIQRIIEIELLIASPRVEANFMYRPEVPETQIRQMYCHGPIFRWHSLSTKRREEVDRLRGTPGPDVTAHFWSLESGVRTFLRFAWHCNSY
jgi:hypothetical protein